MHKPAENKCDSLKVLVKIRGVVAANAQSGMNHLADAGAKGERLSNEL